MAGGEREDGGEGGRVGAALALVGAGLDLEAGGADLGGVLDLVAVVALDEAEN